MDEKKYKFDQFKFIKNRETGIDPTEEEFTNFNNYMSCATLSMHREHIKVVRYFNSIQFSKLTKKQQCLAYTSLDGYEFPYKPYLKKGFKKYSDEIEKLVKLFKISPREARSMIEDGFVNIEKALLLYSEIYEPDTLLTKTGKIKNLK